MSYLKKPSALDIAQMIQLSLHYYDLNGTLHNIPYPHENGQPVHPAIIVERIQNERLGYDYRCACMRPDAPIHLLAQAWTAPANCKNPSSANRSFIRCRRSKGLRCGYFIDLTALYEDALLVTKKPATSTSKSTCIEPRLPHTSSLSKSTNSESSKSSNLKIKQEPVGVEVIDLTVEHEKPKVDRKGKRKADVLDLTGDSDEDHVEVFGRYAGVMAIPGYLFGGLPRVHVFGPTGSPRYPRTLHSGGGTVDSVSVQRALESKAGTSVFRSSSWLGTSVFRSSLSPCTKSSSRFLFLSERASSALPASLNVAITLSLG
ncbi:hypothetical protein K435DRAFT_858527 [Dendrothele bispora CBS 962.96]|uniref:Uncharacterized protein n=1 Tax=Dendrothele bispora (strain CBS 962.96) TaxID=1314807 RepID=A0A4S8M2Y7_DENBC|nr:hypothetical protein K435DRAFT_858527 [Dendrothele bispora CBS 962.96]